MTHTFHIPIMGTGFTIDSPLKVARYGISSVISLVDDVLIEQMRKFYNEKFSKKHIAITAKDKDARAHRITAYLNLLDDLVKNQMEKLQSSSFEPGSEITRYFELLPDSSLKKLYHDMLVTADKKQKVKKQNKLRKLVTPGTIDVNIMTKLDGNRFPQLGPLYSDALSALRGYANSKLDSSIIFSAGFNPNLYNYIAEFDDFYPDQEGYIKKKIVLKVSDYRSAVIQGKYLAKHGLWVSEYRIESAVDCGGHAFANDGMLIGPILEEFKQKKNELIDLQLNLFNKTSVAKGKRPFTKPLAMRFTVQGGVGTSVEHDFLLNYYGVDAVGWGTPFLLVPEAVNVDEEHLVKLANATEAEVDISRWSPLNILFWDLMNSASEEARRKRIQEGKPGAACVKGYARFNTEFTEEPICMASRTYQRYKLEQLAQENLTEEQLIVQVADVLSKSCICHDLAGGATKKYGIDPQATTAVCPGPNIVNFSRIVSLAEMIDHIYGRASILTNPNRPHMFIKELMIQIEIMLEDVNRSLQGLLARPWKQLVAVKANLLTGIAYYQQLAKQLAQGQQDKFLDALAFLKDRIEEIGAKKFEN
jgi:hypothetical protein